MTTTAAETTVTVRGRWKTLAAFALGMVALGPVLMLTAGLVWGLDVGEIIMFLAPAIAIPVLGIVATLKLKTAGPIVAIVAALLTAGALFWTAFGLVLPDSFFEFVPGLLVIPGALIAIGASVAALRARTKPGPAPRERDAIRAIAAALSVAAVVSAVLTVTERSTADPASADAQVAMKDFSFGEDAYTFAGGSTVYVENDDPFQHTFTVDELSIDVAIGPGSSALVHIPAEPGTYQLYCTPHTQSRDEPKEGDMTATLTVS